jgi:hypothetical protein
MASGSCSAFMAYRRLEDQEAFLLVVALRLWTVHLWDVMKKEKEDRQAS